MKIRQLVPISKGTATYRTASSPWTRTADCGWGEIAVERAAPPVGSGQIERIKWSRVASE